MYGEFYKLSGNPFQLGPNPSFFFGSRGHQRALAYLQYGLHQGEGFIVITGDIGTGKTTLLGHLLTQIDPEKYLTAKLVTTQLEADDTLRMVASAFGLAAENVEKATLLRNFERFLQDVFRQGRRVLVLVDEVQNMPIKSLEELRMLSNFQTNGLSSIQFCLLGQPQFREIIAREELRQLRQRVISSYHLGPLDSKETRAYIEYRLGRVNWQSDPVITDEAYLRIHELTTGVPRQINVLSNRLFLCGMLEELHEIDAAIVDRVSSEMTEENLGGAETFSSALSGSETQNGGLKSSPEFVRRLTNLEARIALHEKAIKGVIKLASAPFLARGRTQPAETMDSFPVAEINQ